MATGPGSKSLRALRKTRLLSLFSKTAEDDARREEAREVAMLSAGHAAPALDAAGPPGAGATEVRIVDLPARTAEGSRDPPRDSWQICFQAVIGLLPAS